jgi:hypothetical protein
VKLRLRPSTWANYRTYTTAYVVPILGQIKLQALTPVQLNHLYAYLLEQGRRKTISSGGTGLAPKTVRNVHVMLHSALHDAMRWGTWFATSRGGRPTGRALPRTESLVTPGAGRVLGTRP